MRELFEHHDERLVHKCLHYFPIYERHFAAFRGRRPRILEIGVFHGGSLDLWRRYFGRGTTIVGADLNERCATLAGPSIDIRIGDQGDPDFLESLVEAGPYDIIIEDGSHLPAHQILAAETLWPAVKPGGVMLIEDLCTNYWPEYGGALGNPGSFMEWVKPLVDEVNGWNVRDADYEPSEWTRTVSGLHIYDSVAVFDRADSVTMPLETKMTGRPAFDDIGGDPPEERLSAEHLALLERQRQPALRAQRAARRLTNRALERFTRWSRRGPQAQ